MAAAAPIVSIGMGLYGMKEKRDAAKDSKRIAAENAAKEAKATKKAAEDMAEVNARREAMGRARMAASGIGGATPVTYIKELEKAGRREIDWLKETGLSEYNVALQEGRTAYNEAMSGFWGNFGSAASGVGDLGVQQEWWS